MTLTETGRFEKIHLGQTDDGRTYLVPFALNAQLTDALTAYEHTRDGAFLEAFAAYELPVPLSLINLFVRADYFPQPCAK